MFRICIWAGVDIGKEHPHCLALDARGEQLLSRRVGNDEPELLELIREVLALTGEGEVQWAVDTTTVVPPCSSGSCSTADTDGSPHRSGSPPRLGRLARPGQDRVVLQPRPPWSRSRGPSAVFARAGARVQICRRRP
jgi:hypothetical protein